MHMLTDIFNVFKVWPFPYSLPPPPAITTRSTRHSLPHVCCTFLVFPSSPLVYAPGEQGRLVVIANALLKEVLAAVVSLTPVIKKCWERCWDVGKSHTCQIFPFREPFHGTSRTPFQTRCWQPPKGVPVACIGKLPLVPWWKMCTCGECGGLAHVCLAPKGKP